jgi:hypothetical protein
MDVKKAVRDCLLLEEDEYEDEEEVMMDIRSEIPGMERMECCEWMNVSIG